MTATVWVTTATKATATPEVGNDGVGDRTAAVMMCTAETLTAQGKRF